MKKGKTFGEKCILGMDLKCKMSQCNTGLFGDAEKEKCLKLPMHQCESSEDCALGAICDDIDKVCVKDIKEDYLCYKKSELCMPGYDCKNVYIKEEQGSSYRCKEMLPEYEDCSTKSCV